MLLDRLAKPPSGFIESICIRKEGRKIIYHSFDIPDARFSLDPVRLRRRLPEEFLNSILPYIQANDHVSEVEHRMVIAAFDIRCRTFGLSSVPPMESFSLMSRGDQPSRPRFPTTSLRLSGRKSTRRDTRSTPSPSPRRGPWIGTPAFSTSTRP